MSGSHARKVANPKSCVGLDIAPCFFPSTIGAKLAKPTIVGELRMNLETGIIERGDTVIKRKSENVPWELGFRDV